jgi:hypothetical protein
MKASGSSLVIRPLSPGGPSIGFYSLPHDPPSPKGYGGQARLQGGASTIMLISFKSVYSVYSIYNQQLKCLQKPLHFLQSVYIVGNQQSKYLHYR